LAALLDSSQGLAELYNLLEDSYSKSLLVPIIAHRCLGYRKVRLPLNTPEYWNLRQTVRNLAQSGNNIRLKFRNFKLLHFDLKSIGFPLELYFVPGGVVITFILKQYEYQKRNPPVKALPGDYVIDAGGCWGDTALYFAHNVGETGKVLTFEFESDNLEILRKNLDLNPSTSKIIEVVPKHYGIEQMRNLRSRSMDQQPDWIIMVKAHIV